MTDKLYISDFSGMHKDFAAETKNGSRIKFDELKAQIDSFDKSGLDISSAGKSIEERDIYLIKWGNGSVKILLWSQMHGDEPTATLSILDTINFLLGKDKYDGFRNEIKNKLTVYFVPMLNPDGAERAKRRNAVGIDLNRDANALTSPEAEILMKLVREIKPDFAFNLHDQDKRWAVGNSGTLATISLLAPPFNYKNEINESRARAVKLVVKLFGELDSLLPGGVAKYSDEHDPRSFGDTIAGLNVSTILIESGRHKDDYSKTIARRMNFAAYLAAFRSIARGDYLNISIEDYDKIPPNGEELFDIIFRNANVIINGKNLVFDIAVDWEKRADSLTSKSYFRSCLRDIGDLSEFKGVRELDCSGLTIESRGEIYGTTIDFLSIGERADFVIKKGDKIKYIVENGVVRSAEPSSDFEN